VKIDVQVNRRLDKSIVLFRIELDDARISRSVMGFDVMSANPESLLELTFCDIEGDTDDLIGVTPCFMAPLFTFDDDVLARKLDIDRYPDRTLVRRFEGYPTRYNGISQPFQACNAVAYSSLHSL